MWNCLIEKRTKTPMLYELEMQIPQYRPFSPIVNTLRVKFPFRQGEWFERVVSDERAPTGFDLAYIQLHEPLSEAQVTYLEHGKTAGFITVYRVLENPTQQTGDLMSEYP